MDLVSCTYVVERVDGYYAMLRNIKNPDGDLKQVARALLPPETTEGTELLYEMLQHSVIK